MSEDKPRLARLTAIITQIQSKRIVTARDIADRHGVSIRTVYRDIRTLEQSGIPIITKEGKGYSIMEGYKLPPVMFTEEEANALIMAQQLIRKNKDQSLTNQYDSAVIKIKSILNYTQKNKAELLAERIQIRVNQNEEKTSHHLITLQSTIVNYQRVELTYLSLKNEETKREVEPFALYTTQENWILIAFCQLRKGFRAFRLDRIQQLKVKNLFFEPHAITLEEYLEECRKKILTTPDIPMAQSESKFTENQKINMDNVKIEPFQLVGISVRTSNQNEQAARDIPALWNKFMSENVLDQIPNKVDATIYSVYTDYEGDHTQPYTTILGCKVKSLDAIPEGMVAKTIAGGSYAKSSAKGNLTQGIVIKEWFRIWAMNLNRSYTADFEVYGQKAQNPQDAEVDFFIAVD